MAAGSSIGTREIRIGAALARAVAHRKANAAAVGKFLQHDVDIAVLHIRFIAVQPCGRGAECPVAKAIVEVLHGKGKFLGQDVKLRIARVEHDRDRGGAADAAADLRIADKLGICGRSVKLGDRKLGNRGFGISGNRIASLDGKGDLPQHRGLQRCAVAAEHSAELRLCDRAAGNIFIHRGTIIAAAQNGHTVFAPGEPLAPRIVRICAGIDLHAGAVVNRCVPGGDHFVEIRDRIHGGGEHALRFAFRKRKRTVAGVRSSKADRLARRKIGGRGDLDQVASRGINALLALGENGRRHKAKRHQQGKNQG